MTLLDAKEQDPVKARRRKLRITFVVVLAIVLLAIGFLGSILNHGWWFRYWPKEHVVGNFFGALQKQDFHTAYGIWMHDPNWAQHPGEHSNYPFNEFYKDWGPGGQWGVIKTVKISGASPCPSHGADSSGSGILVDVVVNDRVQHAQVWVENADHTLGFPPCEGELEFH